MRERPILMSGPMVRAILSGTKTQTRRPVKPQPAYPGAFDNCTFIPGNGFVDIYLPGAVLPAHHWHCHLGKPGDRLWVRETFSPFPPHEVGSKLWGIVYGADAEQVEREAPETYRPMLYNYERWSPSIHMPRWACRLVLEVVSVRVERVQQISEADARAEGFADSMAFKDAWEAMYGKKLGAALWSWCWVVEFKRAEASA